MSKTQQKEDGLLQFCYETEIGGGNYEDLVKRIKWNYEAKFDKKPQEGCPVSVCGPFGDRGYIEPFLDFSAYYHASQGTAERVFPTVPRRSVFTRYFNPSARARSYFQCGGGGGFPRATDSSEQGSCSSWLDSVVDTVLLELEDLLDEMNLCCESVPPAGKSVSSSYICSSSKRTSAAAAAAATAIATNHLLLTPYEVAIHSLKARLSDDQFFTCFRLKKTSLANGGSINTGEGSSDNNIGTGIGSSASAVDAAPFSSPSLYLDYDHLPWPWISLPPSNSSTMRLGVSSSALLACSLDEASPRSFARRGGDPHDEDDCLPLSPLHHSSPLSARSSSFSSPGGSLLTTNSSPPLPRAAIAVGVGSVGGLGGLSLDAKPIPVLSPLGLHRAEGGERILSGAGVDHMNLIQLVGNPAHGFQPKLVQSWRSPAYVQWVSQWDAVSISYGL